MLLIQKLKQHLRYYMHNKTTVYPILIQKVLKEVSTHLQILSEMFRDCRFSNSNWIRLLNCST